MIRALALAALLPLSAFADDWTRADTFRQSIVTAAYLVDMAQTRYIAQHPDQYREVGSTFFNGSHPSTGRVNVYFTSVIIGHALISYALPPKYRAALQYAAITVEVRAIRGNRLIGIGFSF